MSREVYLTTVKALAAIEELTEDDEHQIDLVIYCSSEDIGSEQRRRS